MYSLPRYKVLLTGDIPMPVSWISTRTPRLTAPPASIGSTLTSTLPPAGVNFNALDSKCLNASVI